MRLYLIRHGKPEVDMGTCYGSSDLAICERENRRVAEAILPSLPRGVPVLTSPLRRCRGLAEAIAETIHAPEIVQDSRLAEIHFGDWEMRTWDAIPRSEIDAWAADVVHYRPGKGESVLDVATRVRRFYDDMRSSGIADVIVVCHAGTIRLLQQCLSHSLPSDIAHHAGGVRHTIRYGELIILDCP
ncbi:histidine phosphatase family protein [Noviherbaspirillum sp. Root189]|uniref:histidine phosphatase family protein n=1 Tax=Noviherbaspirillum sp. Root189 TaxID=1736487 RepID=UPI0007095566|nr:histidine phosphatase family protein [Noviherbaspirillum sp. Root189]KRB89024.1 phosphoglycerate mutase [Noviherbaspirillum sp. Root189]